MYTRLQPILSVRNLAAEKDFYQKLGFILAYDTADFVAFSYGTTILFGLQHNEAADLSGMEQQLLWQIGTSSVRAVEERCLAAQLDIMEAPQLQPWGEWTLKVQSPNGYTVIFEGPETATPPGGAQDSVASTDAG